MTRSLPPNAGLPASTQPLDGVTVLDFSHVIAGPLATHYLAMLGAHVIKVESPAGGDAMRRKPRAFASLNHGKDVETIDLATSEGLARAWALFDTADVLVDNMRPGVLDRFGLGERQARDRKPHLIHCAISGYGRQGAWSDRPAYDHVVQAASGMMMLSGEPQDGPVKVGFPVVDSATGILAALAILAAIRRRDLTGLGESIDVSMLGAALQLMYPMTVEVLASGATPPRVGNVGYTGSPGAAVFPCADGALALGANTPAQLLKAADVLGIRAVLEPLLGGQSQGFVDAARGAEVDRALREGMRHRSSGELEERLGAAGVPAARVRDMGECVADALAAGAMDRWVLPDALSTQVPGLGFRSRTLHGGRARPFDDAGPDAAQDGGATASPGGNGPAAAAASAGDPLGFAHPLTSPSRQGIMVGFPPPPDRLVTPSTSVRPEFLGWRVQNASRLFPTARIARGDGPIAPLPAGEPLDVERLAVPVSTGGTVPMTEVLHRTVVDSMVVLHRGRIVYERYLGDMAPAKTHAIYSCTKSLVGLLVEMAIHDGLVDPDAPAAQYVPELSRSPLGSACVRQLLDMAANFKFGDQPKVEGQVQVDYIAGLGFLPRPPGWSGANGAYELLVSARPMGPHGGVFRYDNGCTDTLGWLLRRVTGKSLDTLVGERFWSRLGMEHDATFALDAAGVEWAAGGISACARDMARMGEMVRCGGRWNGEQVVPSQVLERILQGGDRTLFAAGQQVLPDGSYRSQLWFYHDRHGSYAFRGQYGQRVWIAPQADTVVVQFGADPQLAFQEPLRLSGLQAIADALRARSA